MKAAKDMFGRLLFALGGDRLVRSRVDARLKNPLRILSGHRVIDEAGALTDSDREDLARGSLTRRSFEEGVLYLSREYRIVALDEAVRRLMAGEPLPARAAVLTFDDGYRDVFLRAYPFLRERLVPFTVFLTTGWIGREGYLGEGDIRQMAAEGGSGICWGAHGVTHGVLSAMSGPEAEREIAESKRAVERLVGRAVGCFAYPDGKFSGEVKQMLLRHGFAAACATGRRLNAGAIDRFALQRIPFEEEALWRFALRVAGRV